MSIIDSARRAGPFLLVLGAGVWLWTVADSFAISTRLGRAGPEVWPRIILALMMGAALWGLLDALFRRRESDETSALILKASRSAGHEEDARQDLAGDADVERHPQFAALGILAMLAYVAVIGYLGYTVSTFLLLLSIMLLAGYRRPGIALVVAFIGAIVFFFVFQRIVYISLPLGTGPFREMSLALMQLFGVK